MFTFWGKKISGIHIVDESVHNDIRAVRDGCVEAMKVTENGESENLPKQSGDQLCSKFEHL